MKQSNESVLGVASESRGEGPAAEQSPKSTQEPLRNGGAVAGGSNGSVLRGEATPRGSSQSPPGWSQVDNELPALQPHHLYAVLIYRGELASWNWAFHVPDPSVVPIGAAGTLFQVVTGSFDEWKFQVKPKDIITWDHVVAIVRLCDVGFLGTYQEAIGRHALLDILESVFRPPKIPPFEFSSKTWFLDAIGVLQDCGVGTCHDIWLLEREIQRFAFRAMDKYLEGKGWTAYRSERCV